MSFQYFHLTLLLYNMWGIDDAIYGMCKLPDMEHLAQKRWNHIRIRIRIHGKVFFSINL